MAACAASCIRALYLNCFGRSFKVLFSRVQVNHIFLWESFPTFTGVSVPLPSHRLIYLVNPPVQGSLRTPQDLAELPPLPPLPVEKLHKKPFVIRQTRDNPFHPLDVPAKGQVIMIRFFPFDQEFLLGDRQRPHYFSCFGRSWGRHNAFDPIVQGLPNLHPLRIFSQQLPAIPKAGPIQSCCQMDTTLHRGVRPESRQAKSPRPIRP